MGKDAYITIKPPVNGESKYSGNSFNDVMAPPKIIDFQADTAVEICFYSASVVNGHIGFQAEITEKPQIYWITSSNYPEDIDENNYADPPEQGYAARINKCWVRSPSKGNFLELEFFQFDVSFNVVL